jgi:hypothetical protein
MIARVVRLCSQKIRKNLQVSGKALQAPPSKTRQTALFWVIEERA